MLNYFIIMNIFMTIWYKCDLQLQIEKEQN